MTGGGPEPGGDDGADTAREDAPPTAFREPYGPPIHDAVESGDLQQMKAVAEAARRSLFKVEFEKVTADRYDEVKNALEALEAAIARLERGGEAAG